MVVNMPSEQELAAARMKLAQEKNKSPVQSDPYRPPPSQWASSSSQPGQYAPNVPQSGQYPSNVSQQEQHPSNVSQPGQDQWPQDNKSYPPDTKY